MIGSFLTRGLVLVLGYAYPAYECYKTVEKNKPEIEHLLFWCQYWILVAVLTVCERLGDAFVSWVPMYSEAKLAFFVYLWYPKTRGTTYVYDSFFRPYVSKHENEIDRNLYELRTLAGDMIVLYWQRAASYGQTRVFEILHYVMAQPAPAPAPAPAAQSKQTPASPTQSKQAPALAPQSKQAPAPRSVQNSPKQDAKARQPTQGASRQPAARKKLAEVEEPPSPASSTSSTQQQKEVAQEVGTSEVSKPAAPATESKTETANVASDKGSGLKEAELETMQMEPVAPKGLLKTNSVPKETVMEETIRLTRGRLRKARSAGVR